MVSFSSSLVTWSVVPESTYQLFVDTVRCHRGGGTLLGRTSEGGVKPLEALDHRVTFLAAELVSNHRRSSTFSSTATLLATPKATTTTAATATDVVIVVGGASTTALSGHIRRRVLGNAIQLHALLKTD
jgi:hypothetical protein